jgi:hypothetical protein
MIHPLVWGPSQTEGGGWAVRNRTDYRLSCLPARPVIATRDQVRDYDAYRETRAEQSRQRSRSGRDIGPIPPIANPERREACRHSLRLFCETYNPEAFYLGWSPDHLRMIERIEESVFHGALFAFAMPRGSGKTSICRMATLWSVSYALVRYCYLIGATAGKGAESLDAIKVWMRYLPDYTADFPEISVPATAIGGMANRAPGQIWIDDDGNEQSTLIRWEKERIVLPRVPKPPNLDCDGFFAPTSGCVIGVSGLTAEGIRGSLFAHPDGRLIRPDFVLLDDPQTDESSSSITQNETREQLISGAVLGMAGPDKTIAAVMPCTVINPGDMVDNVLDRTKHPLWRGERTKLLRSMPKNMEAWDRYFEVYRACKAAEPPDIGPANAYYIEHRESLDEGAEASWEARKLPDEVSAIQHAMHLYCRDPVAFMAEYQNDPISKEATHKALTPDIVVAKASGRPWRDVPINAKWLTAHIDVHDNLLYYGVCAISPDSTASIIDYGSWPKQGRSYYTLDDARPTMREWIQRQTNDQIAKTATSKQAVILAGIVALAKELHGREYIRHDGTTAHINLCLIDIGYEENTVMQAIQLAGLGDWLKPARGIGIKAGDKPLAEWKGPKRDKGDNWLWMTEDGRKYRIVKFDANHWKSRARDGVAAAFGDAGCITLPGRKEEHQMIGEHWSAEYPVETEGRGRTLEEWKQKPGRDNHLFDNLVGCLVAGSVLGAVLPGTGVVQSKPTAPRLSLAEMKARARKH